MKRLIWQLPALALVAVLNVVNAADEYVADRLNLFTENYGSYNYSIDGREYEHDGENIGGSSTEFIKKLMDHAGIPYKMKLRSWRVSYERALTRPDYGVFSTGRTELREDLFEWVGPIARYNWIVMVKKDSPLQINSLEDIRGLKVGGYRNDAVTEYVQNAGIEVSDLPNESANPHLLQDGLIDVWVTSDVSAWSVAEATGYTEIEVGYVFKTVDMYLAMNKDTRPEWLDQLYASYDALVEAGELELPTYE
ncbi:substrate-binding periplasmic protein [Reinekea marinisedimentorum]|uniref:Polar amino acid transport system substrate-binding protein n=1 Tax=Reinekea marinisedimentorum TaxID=230495 RepID=A0A4R3HZD9_9GAMM|nr:ABC transporter substrate-binding protein [Reinekea marinisedimentorum]TCS38767.1 polar amino acid transport system substrate-binding protein [Reinekea marinisedimentorum]